MNSWVHRYAAKERQRTEAQEKVMQPFANALMRQIDADVAIYREEFPESGRGITVEVEGGRVQRDFSFNNIATVLVTLRDDKILWEYKGCNVGGKPGQFTPKAVDESVAQLSEKILKPILFPHL